MMKSYGYWFMRGAASALFIAVFVSVALAFIIMALWLIISPVVPPQAAEIWQDMRCAWGYPSQADGTACIQKKLTEVTERAKVEKARLEAKSEKDQSAAKDLQRRIDRIAKIEQRYKNIHLFAEGFAEGLLVSTGVRYEDLSKTGRWANAWCYTKIRHNGVNINITLGNRKHGKPVVRAKHKPQELAVIGARSVDKLVAACKWPDSTA